MGQLEQDSLDSTWQGINSVVRRHDCLAFAGKAEADDVISGDEQLGGAAVRRDANDTVAAAIAGRDVKITILSKCQALGPAKAAKELLVKSFLIDDVHSVVTCKARRGDIKPAVRP